MTSFHQRYLNGETLGVWEELQALGEKVRNNAIYPDALAVAHETMERVKQNIQILIPRLQNTGYTFGYTGRLQDYGENQGPLFQPPQRDIAEKLAQIEQRYGLLPISLHTFYEVVGCVNFTGAPPPEWQEAGIQDELLDALYVTTVEDSESGIELWEEDVSEWEEVRPEDDTCDTLGHRALPFGCHLWPISPDEWLKYDVSGCGSNDIALPCSNADARVLTERHRTTFVDYLRICFRWAGLPGLEDLDHHAADIGKLVQDLHAI